MLLVKKYIGFDIQDKYILKIGTKNLKPYIGYIGKTLYEIRIMTSKKSQ